MTVTKSNGIDVLDTNAARTYTHIHPVLVLSGYFLAFPYVVANPISSLSTLLIPLSILQVIYVVLCLPATGTPTSSKAHKKTSKGKNETSLFNRVTPAIISLTLSLFLGTPLLTALLILFGAPLTTHIPHTALCAAHISLLTSLPLIYVYGVETDKWRRIAALMVPVDEVFGAAVGGCLGAWVGAVPIPLDWDREWQRWPVTIVTGAFLGWAVGKTAGGMLKGKLIDLSP